MRSRVNDAREYRTAKEIGRQGTRLLDFGVLRQDGLVARAEKLVERAGITAQSDNGCQRAVPYSKIDQLMATPQKGGRVNRQTD